MLEKNKKPKAYNISLYWNIKALERFLMLMFDLGDLVHIKFLPSLAFHIARQRSRTTKTSKPQPLFFLCIISTQSFDLVRSYSWFDTVIFDQINIDLTDLSPELVLDITQHYVSICECFLCY